MKNVFDFLALSRFVDNYRKKKCIELAKTTAINQEDFFNHIHAYDISLINNTYLIQLAKVHLEEKDSVISIYEYICDSLFYRLEKIDDELKSYLSDKLVEDDYESVAELIQEKLDIRQLLRMLKYQLFPSRSHQELSTSPSYDESKDFHLNPHTWNYDDFINYLPLTYKKCFNWSFLPNLCKTFIIPRKQISRTIFNYLRTCGINSRFFVFSTPAFENLREHCTILKEDKKYSILYDEDKYNYFIFEKDDNFYLLSGFYNEHLPSETVSFVLNQEIVDIINSLPTTRKFVVAGTNYFTPKTLIFVE